MWSCWQTQTTRTDGIIRLTYCCKWPGAWLSGRDVLIVDEAFADVQPEHSVCRVR